jgi:hypothetical protein
MCGMKLGEVSKGGREKRKREIRREKYRKEDCGRKGESSRRQDTIVKLKK